MFYFVKCEAIYHICIFRSLTFHHRNNQCTENVKTVVSSPALYPRSTSRIFARVPAVLRVFVVLLIFSRKILGQYIKIGRDRFFPSLFMIHSHRGKWQCVGVVTCSVLKAFLN